MRVATRSYAACASLYSAVRGTARTATFAPMATDPRAALDRLVAALHAHLEAATTAQDPEEDAVLDAASALADAFDAYDEALYDATGVDTPFYLDDDDLDDDADEEDDDLEDLDDLDDEDADEDDDDADADDEDDDLDEDADDEDDDER
ncbi:MAG TPA: hypothetical protein VKY71_10710 [Actinotalea caeni]|uniref:hypothetical protein n=1 Tax=Actinotalea caeni TaxID=1348467 RepID=UPI002B4B03CE|nr:hypothetical protein [Actinotalea caeni]HLV56029.1 hypothetical protein [Actinotalea caeni]